MFDSKSCLNVVLLYSGGVTLVDEETLAGGHVPLPDGRVCSPGDHVGVLHRHAIDVAAVAPGKYVDKDQDQVTNDAYFRTPRHSVSSVLVAHILAVASSLPVTSMEPSSDKHMQLMLSSWSAMVSNNSPFLPPVDPPAPMMTLFRTLLWWSATSPDSANYNGPTYSGVSEQVIVVMC